MGHLDKVQKQGSINSMTISNLAIVFGPTLFRPPPGQEASSLADMSWQCKSIETILTHYEAIFVPTEDEEVPNSAAPTSATSESATSSLPGQEPALV